MRRSGSPLAARLQALAGWLPAIILPSATFFQLWPVLQGQTAGVSALSWFLFGIANLGAYIFSTQKRTPQVILAFLVTAAMDFLIVLRCLL
ncbi:hypothetical protein [Geitlerinema sp. PCC 7407]|uniref:hypothetical protein n=1 Tax=Geitlerinema sp. PCC 7407 TaxID=1173025 RepID=UPI00029FCFE1|nr:hypothetical protein [Geitlerinema sp. PCC 7407]AFY66382.1 hypothetical protein GEI7407_1900 [Geitlerinema sp. PCC 7407]